MTTQTVIISDRNEVKFLFALGLTGEPTARDSSILDFKFPATEELFKHRRDFSLNAPIPVLAFITASRLVDKAIHNHRQSDSIEISTFEHRRGMKRYTGGDRC